LNTISIDFAVTIATSILKTFFMSESLEDLAAKIGWLETQIAEHDTRLDTIEAESNKRSQANRELIQRKFTQVKQGSGVALAILGFVLAFYVSWDNLDKDTRSQLSNKFVEGAIPIILGLGGYALASNKKNT
jgi:hypothetical protein